MSTKTMIRMSDTLRRNRGLPALLLVSVACLLLTGCVTTGAVGTSSTGELRDLPPTPAPDTSAFVAPTPVGPIAGPGEVAEPVPGGSVDWSGRTVRARGTGVMDLNNPNKAQARLMAERAAVVVAQRNLLEIIKGVRVDSDTRVQNYMTDYDVVYTHVDGMVRGARQRGPSKYDSTAGTVEVELEVPMYGDSSLESVLAPVLSGPGGGGVSAASLSPQTREFLRQYSGLVFDGGGTGLKPAMFPKIYDENGNLLLDTRDYLKYAGQSGTYAVQFINSVDRVLARPEFSSQPLVLKVKEIRGKLGTDIVLGSGEAGKVKWLKDGFKFLMDAGRFLVKLLL
jgi:hypothetical protein